MEFIKKNKKLCIIGTILLVFLILLFILLKCFSVDYSKSEYGDRLKGINDVKISSSTEKKLENEMKELSEVKDCNYRLQGRLIYINITFNEGVSIDTAREVSNKVLEYFDEDEKKYYDMELILTNENKDSEGYPEMGYKHKTSESIVW